MGSKNMKKSKRKISGREKFTKWIREQQRDERVPPGWKFSISAFAGFIGVSRQMVRFWMIGKAKPDADHRDLIAGATNGEISATVWD